MLHTTHGPGFWLMLTGLLVMVPSVIINLVIPVCPKSSPVEDSADPEDCESSEVSKSPGAAVVEMTDGQEITKPVEAGGRGCNC